MPSYAARIRRLKAKLNSFNLTAVWREGKKQVSEPTDEELVGAGGGKEQLEEMVRESGTVRETTRATVYKKDIRERIREADRVAIKLREKAKEQHNCMAQKLQELRPGMVVRVQHHLTKCGDLIGTIMEVKPR